ncbi:CCA tRNA nucleotidyltransferase [Yoonia sp. 2307UL14-13]|uniref:CCA tRNA nucleotidyltransferase n=1 Tax=Yoonia sp. 2307UL14-13 TaxID=3126506 RepID=UPI0030AC050F
MKITDAWLTQKPSQQVCAMLTDTGHQAWFVGGCVRNALLGELVADLDLSTDAHPETVMELAKAAGLKVIPTGIEHGTVTVVADDIPFEITTFRRDVATDGRRATVAFADNMTDDARRRDFTMNALYADADGNIADPLGGLPDLQARRIRFIEDPEQRIKEDYLRILRFFRFHAWYGQDGPDPDGLAACAAHVEGLQTLSVERVTSELLKLLSAPNPAPAVASMAATGALGQILPGSTAKTLPVLIHLESQANLAPDPIRRLAALGGTPVENLRLSKEEAKRLALIQSETPLPELAYREGAAIGTDALAVRSAALSQDIDQTLLKQIQHAAQQVFPLKAADLMPALRGPALGQALKEAEAKWIASAFTLTKDDLLG